MAFQFRFMNLTSDEALQKCTGVIMLKVPMMHADALSILRCVGKEIHVKPGKNFQKKFESHELDMLNTLLGEQWYLQGGSATSKVEVKEVVFKWSPWRGLCIEFFRKKVPVQTPVVVWKPPRDVHASK